MKFKIKENVFDSGVIAQKVGDVTIEDIDTVKPLDGDFVADYARKDGYKLVTLCIQKPVTINGFVHLGVVNEVNSSVSDAWENVNNIPEKFNVRPINENDWSSVEELLQLYPSNRYSKDPNVTKKQVILHKMLILKHLAKTYPAYALGAFTKESEMIGFHFLRLTGSDFLYLQELLVKPSYRIGFVSLQLVKENLKAVMKNTNIKQLSTRVYEDNTSSLNFFNKLGFSNLKKKDYYYHMWV